VPPIATYRQFGGLHPQTAALTNVLSARRIVAPHTGAPFSEAMIFGISGGLGIGYILWEFEEHRGQHDARVLVLAFQKDWQYSDRYLKAACQRLSLLFSMPTTGSPTLAARALHDALAEAIPVVAWVDGASMPYLQLPESMRGHFAHVVVACGTAGEDVLIDDLAAQPFKVPADVLAEARSRIPSFKNRLLVVDGAGDDLDLDAAIQAGIAACAEHLSSDSASFSLPAIRKWARLMTDENNPKGWPVVFKDRRGLYGALTAIFEATTVQGSPGGLRRMYSDFLVEAADVLDNPRLEEPAERYAALAHQWDELADEALPDTVPQFQRTKQVLRERHDARLMGGDAWQATRPLTEELDAIGSECDLTFPLGDREVMDLFSGLQARLLAIHRAEVQAVESLKESAA
jgi:hypothetical protein